MFNLGAEKLLVIFFIVLLVVGPDKLPDLARKAGKAVSDLRRMSGGFQDELRNVLDEPLQTFTREFNRATSSDPSGGRATSVEASSGVSPTSTADKQPEPSGAGPDALGEPAAPVGSTLPAASAHQAPEQFHATVQPVPVIQADQHDVGAGDPDSNHRDNADKRPTATLPGWVFGTSDTADTPHFH